MEKRIIVGITGASGAIYAEKLVEELFKSQEVARIYLVATQSGKDVSGFELKEKVEGFSLRQALENRLMDGYSHKIRVFQNDNLFAPFASGSSVPTHMIIVPCSMGTLARIATGQSGNLLERSADVMLKQKKPLLLVPRETPLNAIHLKNMLELSQMGAHIVPAMPAFYQKPKSIEDLISFMVGRMLELCDLSHSLYRPWNAQLI